MITRRINGGLNGYADRLECYTRLALVALGYPPDAVRAWQSDNRLTVDGIAGPATRALLHDALVRAGGSLPATPSLGSMPVLRRGAKGPDVATLQTLLNAAGASLKVDKDFGGQTHNAVIAFQRREHLTADGVVGRIPGPHSAQPDPRATGANPRRQHTDHQTDGGRHRHAGACRLPVGQ